MESIGMKIRRFRKIKGLTQEQLGKAADISTMSVRRYESGERVVTEEVLQRIADALEVDITNFYMSVKVGWGDEPLQEILTEPREREEAINAEVFLKYDQLNLIGKVKARDYINDLYSMPKYKEILK